MEPIGGDINERHNQIKRQPLPVEWIEVKSRERQMRDYRELCRCQRKIHPLSYVPIKADKIKDPKQLKYRGEIPGMDNTLESGEDKPQSIFFARE